MLVSTSSSKVVIKQYSINPISTLEIRIPLMIMPFCYLLMPVQSQNYYENGQSWIEKAEQLKPDLVEQIVHPVAVIEVVTNDDAFQGREAKKVAEPEQVYTHSFRQQKSVILDFGNHFTGYFSFDLETLWGTSDAPVRFRLSNTQANALTSAAKKPAPLAVTTPEKIVKIDQTGLNTLKECMQTMYEDGPKRDRRLWGETCTSNPSPISTPAKIIS